MIKIFFLWKKREDSKDRNTLGHPRFPIYSIWKESVNFSEKSSHQQMYITISSDSSPYKLKDHDIGFGDKSEQEKMALMPRINISFKTCSVTDSPAFIC